MPKTVAYYIDSGTVGGAEEVLFTVIKGINRDLWQPALIYHPSPELEPFIERINELGSETISLPQIRSYMDIKGIMRFKNELMAINPSIFHANMNWPLSCSYGIIASYLARVNATIATQHLYKDLDSRRQRAIQKLISIAVDRYIAVSKGVSDELKRDIFSPDKVDVIYNGIPIENFSDHERTNNSNPVKDNKNRTVVLTVARLNKHKGHKFLLEAASKVKDARFLLAGEGPERRYIEQLTDQLGIRDRVSLLGRKDDIPELLSECDIFVLPSLLEGLPLSIIEAMAAGMPVIATDIKGIDELVIDGETGILVPPEDPEALAGAIQSCVSNPNYAKKLGEAGKMRAKQHFSDNLMVKRVCELYCELVNT